MMKDLDKDVVSVLVESAGWEAIDMKPKLDESVEQDSDTLEVLELEDEESNEGLWTDEDGNFYYVSEDTVYECLTDDEGDVYFLDEEDQLFEVYEDEDDLVLEAVEDIEDYELLVEDEED